MPDGWAAQRGQSEQFSEACHLKDGRVACSWAVFSETKVPPLSHCRHSPRQGLRTTRVSRRQTHHIEPRTIPDCRTARCGFTARGSDLSTGNNLRRRWCSACSRRTVGDPSATHVAAKSMVFPPVQKLLNNLDTRSTLDWIHQHTM